MSKFYSKLVSDSKASFWVGSIQMKLNYLNECKGRLDENNFFERKEVSKQEKIPLSQAPRNVLNHQCG